MGAMTSRNFEEMLEEDISPSPPQSKRILEQDLDPRSPTNGIIRTPIQVLKTPEFLADPRSPTAGIDRTPICSKAENTPVTSVAGTQESVVTSLEPVRMSDLAEMLAQAQQEDKEDTSKAPDQPTTVVISKKTEVKVLQDPNQKKVKKSKTVNIGHTNTDSDEYDGKKTTPRSPLKVLGDRSPLSTRNVDYNSPRAIVQRKQVGKLALKKAGVQTLGSKNSPMKYRTMEEDKENL